MSQIVIAILVILANVVFGIIAKRQKDAEKKKREEAALRQSFGGAAPPTVDADPDGSPSRRAGALDDLLDELLDGGTPRRQSPAVPPMRAPATPTRRPEMPMAARQVTPPPPPQRSTMSLRASPAMPIRTTGGGPLRVPPGARGSSGVQPPRPVNQRGGTEVRPKVGTDPESESSFVSRRAERSASSEMEAKKRARQVEHARQRAERNAGKLARQAMAKARQVRSVAARATRMRPTSRVATSPMVAAIRAVFAKPETARTAFIAGEIISKPLGERQAGAR